MKVPPGLFQPGRYFRRELPLLPRLPRCQVRESIIVARRFISAGGLLSMMGEGRALAPHPAHVGQSGGPDAQRRACMYPVVPV